MTDPLSPSTTVVLLVVLLLAGGLLLGCDDPNALGPPDPHSTLVPTVDPLLDEALCQATIECGGAILDEPKAPCTLTVARADGTVDYQGSAGIELRGRSSLWFPKRSFAVELRDHQELSVWPGGTWSYLDDGTDPGPAWTAPGFDDGDWSVGPAPLGHGVDWLQTELSADGGPDGRSVTRYFRRTFEVASLADVTAVVIGVLREDGAAVYVGGVEVARDNLAPDARRSSPALAPDDGVQWRKFEVDPSLLVAGPNTIAVEVHSAGPIADGLRFDLYVEAKGEDRSASLLGMGGESDWVLDGLYADRALFRNRLAYDVFDSFGSDRYAADTRFCELSIDGEELGLYALGESLERDDDRIDIGSGGDTGESFVVKLGDGLGFHDNAIGNGTWELVFPDATPEVEQVVTEALVAWEDAVLGPAPADPLTGVFAHLDLDSAVDWVLLQEVLKNPDGYQLSVWLWRDEGGLMQFAPWDFDLAMGGFPDDDCSAEGWVSRTSWTETGEHPARYVDVMATIPAFRDRLVERWDELRGDELSEARLLERVAGYDATLAPGLEANLARWPIDEVVFDVGSHSLCPVGTWADEHARVVSFLEERLRWMDAHVAEF